MTPELARLRKTFDSPSCACPLRGAAVVNQAPAKSTPGLGPSGFHPHASGLRPARSACRLYRTAEGATPNPASRPGWPIPPGNQDRGRAGQQAGRCSSSRGEQVHGSGNRPAVAHRPGDDAHLVRGQLHRSLWPLLGPRSLDDFCVWAGRLRKSGLRRPRAAPLDPQAQRAGLRMDALTHICVRA